jgi:hypothetical protein
VSIGVFCALCIIMFPKVWVIIVNYKRSYILLGRAKVVSYCSCSYVLGFIMCRLLSVQVVIVPIPIHYMRGYISRSAIFPVWLFFVETFPWSGYVFGGGSLSSRPCSKRCSGFLNFLCRLAQIRVGREAMRAVFVRPLGDLWSVRLGRLVV